MSETPSPLGSVRRATEAHGTLQGMALMGLSTVCMASMYAAIRHVGGGMHAFEMAFFRNLIGLLLLLAWHWRHLGWAFSTGQLRLHLLRGTLNALSMVLFFYAIMLTPLADIAALAFAAPLFASLMAILLLKEPFRAHRVTAIACGFIGTLVVLRPGLGVMSEGHLVLTVSVALWAVTLVVIKVLARQDSSTTITLYMVAVMTPLSFLAAVFVWQWPSGSQLAWLVLIAALGTVGQYSLSQAFRLADATAVLPLDFLKLVWSTLLGFFLFAEVPDLWALLGGAMIFGGTSYLALCESRPAPPSLPAAAPAASISQPDADPRG